MSTSGEYYTRQVYNRKRGFSLYFTQKMVTLLSLFLPLPIFLVRFCGGIYPQGQTPKVLRPKLPDLHIFKKQ